MLRALSVEQSEWYANKFCFCSMKVSRERPIERCNECGNVVKLHYDGPEEDPHARMSFPFFFFFFC